MVRPPQMYNVDRTNKKGILHDTGRMGIIIT